MENEILYGKFQLLFPLFLTPKREGCYVKKTPLVIQL